MGFFSKLVKVAKQALPVASAFFPQLQPLARASQVVGALPAGRQPLLLPPAARTGGFAGPVTALPRVLPGGALGGFGGPIGMAAMAGGLFQSVARKQAKQMGIPTAFANMGPGITGALAGAGIGRGLAQLVGGGATVVGTAAPRKRRRRGRGITATELKNFKRVDKFLQGYGVKRTCGRKR